MSKILFSELLILGALLPSVIHTFVKKKEPARAVAALIPLAAFFLFLATIAYGISVGILVVWITVFFVFLCNIGQLYKFYLNLISDSTVLSYFSAIFQFALITAAIAFCLIFRPVLPPEDKNSQVIQTVVFTRTDDNRFIPREQALQHSDAVLTLVYPSVYNEDTPIAVYLPDIYANAADCAATAAAIAEQGFIVVLADFYLLDSAYGRLSALKMYPRPFLFRMQEYFTPEKFTAKKVIYLEEKNRELDFFMNILHDTVSPISLQNRNLYLLAEGNIKSLAENAKERYSDISEAYLIHTEQTPVYGYIDGYGNVAVFHPFEAFLRGTKRTDGWLQAYLIAQSAAKELYDTH